MSKKRTGLIAGGLAAAVLVGGGAYAAVTFLGDNELDLATVTPASSFVYAEMDLDPSGMQKLTGYKMFNKIDEIAKNEAKKSGDDYKNLEESLYETHFKGIPLEDIRAWQTGQVAVASVQIEENNLDKSGAVTIYEVSNQKKALETMNKMQSTKEDKDTVYSLNEGYMTVSTTKEVDDKYKSELTKGTLADNVDFKEDVKKAGDNLAFAWMNIGELYDISQSQLAESASSVSSMTGVSEPGTGALENYPDIDGRMTSSIAFSDSALDLDIKFSGIKVDGELAKSKSSKGLTEMGNLSKNTLGAVAGSIDSEYMTKEWNEYKEKNPEDTYEIEFQAKENLDLNIPEDFSKVFGDEFAFGVDQDINMQGIIKGDTEETWTKIIALINETNASMGASDMISYEHEDGKSLITAESGKGAIEGKLSENPLFGKAVENIDKSSMAGFLDLNKLAEEESYEVKDLGAVGLTVTSDGIDGEASAKIRWVIE